MQIWLSVSVRSTISLWTCNRVQTRNIDTLIVCKMQRQAPWRNFQLVFPLLSCSVTPGRPWAITATSWTDNDCKKFILIFCESFWVGVRFRSKYLEQSGWEKFRCDIYSCNRSSVSDTKWMLRPARRRELINQFGCLPLSVDVYGLLARMPLISALESARCGKQSLSLAKTTLQERENWLSTSHPTRKVRVRVTSVCSINCGLGAANERLDLAKTPSGWR